MDGPRTLKSGEMASLGRLVNIVFQGKEDGSMLRWFPTLFSEKNLDNLSSSSRMETGSLATSE